MVAAAAAEPVTEALAHPEAAGSGEEDPSEVEATRLEAPEEAGQPEEGVSPPVPGRATLAEEGNPLGAAVRLVEEMPSYFPGPLSAPAASASSQHRLTGPCHGRAPVAEGEARTGGDASADVKIWFT